MFVERSTFKIKQGKFQELLELVKEWREAHPFPLAKSVRHSQSYIVGSNMGSFMFELEFDTLADLEEGWNQWNAMAEEMAPYLERWNDIIERPTNNELWKII